MTTSILFLCPHNAAKSVFAAAYARRSAADLGIAVDASTAGTEPDDDLLPVVRDRLERDGYPIDETPPRRVEATDLDRADLVVNIGCDRTELPTETPIIDWRIPNFSDDPPAAFHALEAHVVDLLAGLDDA